MESKDNVIDLKDLHYKPKTNDQLKMEKKQRENLIAAEVVMKNMKTLMDENLTQTVKVTKKRKNSVLRKRAE